MALQDDAVAPLRAARGPLNPLVIRLVAFLGLANDCLSRNDFPGIERNLTAARKLAELPLMSAEAVRFQKYQEMVCLLNSAWRDSPGPTRVALLGRAEALASDIQELRDETSFRDRALLLVTHGAIHATRDDWKMADTTWAAAAAELERAKAEPNSEVGLDLIEGNLLNNRGVAALILGQNAQAATYFKAALNLPGDVHTTKLNLLLAHVRARQTSEATALAQEIAQSVRKKEEHILIGLSCGSREQAVAHYRIALEQPALSAADLSNPQVLASLASAAKRAFPGLEFSPAEFAPPNP